MIKFIILLFILVLSPVRQVHGASFNSNLAKSKKLYYAGKKKSALRLLKKNLSSKRKHAGTIEFLAEIHEDRKSYAKALKTYEVIVKKFYSSKLLTSNEKSAARLLKKMKLKGKKSAYFSKLLGKMSATAKKGMGKNGRKSKRYNQFAKKLRRYNVLTKALTSRPRRKLDSRKALENSAMAAYKSGNSLKAAKVFKQLIAKYYSKEILKTNNKNKLDQIIDSRFQKNLLDNKIQAYFKYSILSYKKLIKKYKGKVSNKKIKALFKVGKKYLYIYKRNKELLAGGLKQETEEEDGDLPDEEEEGGDLPDEEDGGDLPDEEESSSKNERYTRESTYWSADFSFLTWQEKVTVTEGSSSGSLDVIARGWCLGGAWNKPLGPRTEMSINGCLLVGTSNLGGNTPASSTSIFQEEISTSALKFGSAIHYKALDFASIGGELSLISRSTSFSDLSEASSGAYAVSDDDSDLMTFVLFISARFEWQSLQLSQRFGKSGDLEGIWMVQLDYIF